MPDIWEIAGIAAKFCLYLGVLGAAGTVFAAVLLGRDLGPWRVIAATFATLGLCAAAVGFALRGAALTGDASGLIDPEMLGLLWQTPVGSALTWRVLGLGLLIVGLVLIRIGPWMSAVGGALAVWSFDHVGHVQDRDLIWMDAALTLHLLGVALWIGVLTPLRRLALSDATTVQAAAVGDRFGRIAAFVVPVLVVAGLVMAYVLVGSLAALFSTGYGLALLIKIALVCGLLGLAALNKLRFVPRLREGDGRAARHLGQTITLEWGGVLAILMITAILTSILNLPV